MTEWVKVTKDKKTLPESMATVWIHTKFYTGYGCHYGFEKNGTPIWWKTPDPSNGHFQLTGYSVTHWMPLPDDPKDA